MRLRLRVHTHATELPWDSVLDPGRGLIYEILREIDPSLGRTLHDHGWGPHRMVPIGHGAPVFAVPKRPGVYAAGGAGTLEFGSPLPAVVHALAVGFKARPVLDWGGVALRVNQIELIDPPSFESGRCELRTSTPVVLKGSGRDEAGVRTTRQAWLLPHEQEYPAYLAQNLRRKAQTLGLAPEVELDQILWAGTKRSFTVKQGKKVGAPVAVQLSGSPQVLQAIHSWGLGQGNPAGFGWVSA
jgi:Uncharacterized protein predicted to be involved in DNA repair (RAMP superfamily)